MLAPHQQPRVPGDQLTGQPRQHPPLVGPHFCNFLKLVSHPTNMWLQLATSIVDPNTFNLDPDPEFLHNLDPGPGLCYKFSRNTIFLKKFETIRQYWNHENFLVS